MKAGRPRRVQAGASRRLSDYGIDGVTLLILPAALYRAAAFVYPFAYGLVLSFAPKNGDGSPTTRAFFSDPYLYRHDRGDPETCPAGHAGQRRPSVPIAFRVRLMSRQRVLTTILVLPITLGTVLVAEGLFNYLGPQGWFNRTLLRSG